MSRKSVRQGHKARRQWAGGGWLVVIGTLLAGALALFAGLPGSRKAAAELAPDLTLTTTQGEFRLSQETGKIVVLYFSFVG